MQKLNRFALVVVEGRRMRAVKDSRYIGCPFCHEIEKIEEWKVREWERKRLSPTAPFSYHAVCPNCGRISTVLRLSFYNNWRRKIRWNEMVKNGNEENPGFLCS